MVRREFVAITNSSDLGEQILSPQGYPTQRQPAAPLDLKTVSSLAGTKIPGPYTYRDDPRYKTTIYIVDSGLDIQNPVGSYYQHSKTSDY